MVSIQYLERAVGSVALAASLSCSSTSTFDPQHTLTGTKDILHDTETKHTGIGTHSYTFYRYVPA